jgi:hypothetical protein
MLVGGQSTRQAEAGRCGPDCWEVKRDSWQAGNKRGAGHVLGWMTLHAAVVGVCLPKVMCT